MLDSKIEATSVEEIRSSVCALDCPDACSIDVHVNELGRAVRLKGNASHPVTRGFLCSKVTRYLEREYHPGRLVYPMRRTGAKGSGEFARIDWDSALDEIAERLGLIAREFGPESVLPYSYGGTMGHLNGGGMDRRFFHRLGASQLDRTICASAGGEALMRSQGIRLGLEPQAFVSSKLIIAWGANILGTNVHLWPFIVEARRRGARFYAIDPVSTRTTRASDRHYVINPGSDLALALGLAHVILREDLQDDDYIARYSSGFDELAALVEQYTPERVAHWTGIAAEDIKILAREYAALKPAAIRLNYGVQRSDRGGAAVRAIALLPILTGSWRQPGGGLQLSTSGAFQLNKASLEMPELQFRSTLGRLARVINMSQLGSALATRNDPPVKALIVYNSNPAAVAPAQAQVLKGLRRTDLFTVSLEHLMTDTARYADLVLPATTFLEHSDLYSAYGHYYLQWAGAVLEAPGEARSNVEIFRAIALRMGFDEPCFLESDDEMIRGLLRTDSPYLQGITLERLKQERFIRLKVDGASSGALGTDVHSPNGSSGSHDTPFLLFATGGFATPSGRFEFGAETLEYVPPVESRFGDPILRARYPLELITSKNDAGLNSTFSFRPELLADTAVLTINPKTAGTRGIANGDFVVVRNDRGSCVLTARLSEDISANVVASRSLGPNGPNQRGVNQLTSERLTDLGGGATFYSCLVEVERADRHVPG